MDLLSVFRFCRVNRRARHMTYSVRKYQCVVRHSLDCFRTILRVGVGTEYTLDQLVRLLYTAKCAICPNVPAHVFLPTAQRLCRLCSRASFVVGPLPAMPIALPAAKVCKASGIPIRELRKKVPMVRPLTGNGGPIYLSAGPLTLCTQEQALRALRLCGMDSEENREAVVEQFDALFEVEPSLESTFLSLQRGCLPHLLAKQSIFTALATARLPVLDAQTNKLVDTYICWGCQLPAVPGTFLERIYSRGQVRWGDEIYSRDEMLEHLETCEDAMECYPICKDVIQHHSIY